jgi:hypothetical protein
MLMVVRGDIAGDKSPRTDLALVCARCLRRFAMLEEAYVCYQTPARVGRRAEVLWCHKRCIERAPLAPGGGQTCLWRGDFALRRLLEALLQPDIPVEARKDLPRPLRGPRGEL